MVDKKKKTVKSIEVSKVEKKVKKVENVIKKNGAGEPFIDEFKTDKAV